MITHAEQRNIPALAAAASKSNQGATVSQQDRWPNER
jgi:hypothetical protein